MLRGARAAAPVTDETPAVAPETLALSAPEINASHRQAAPFFYWKAATGETDSVKEDFL